MYRDILRRYWGYDDFRGIQREIIESITKGRDTLGLMPTGGGKSVTFQVPALAMKGVCVVVTPLIALMKDQVAHLHERDIPAAAVYSGMTHDEILATLENAVFGAYKILYVSPERLATEVFRSKFTHADVSFITVDEAHCISQWGYDFRPSYLEIAEIRKLKPDVPVLALTATATPRVIDDIQLRLGFKESNVFRMSFERKNLAYKVRRTQDKQGELLNILNTCKGCAIVYVRSRRRARETSDALTAAGISSTYYHAGLTAYERDERQRRWTGGEMRVMVATNAFGMGIDKPDVRIVVHIDCPDSVEAYFQEAGRAGRDGQPSQAILLFNGGDNRKLRQRIADSYPPKDYILRVYEHLAYFYQVGVGSGRGASFEFSMEDFCSTYGFFSVHVDASLRILTRAGYIDYVYDEDRQSRLMFRLGRSELNRLDDVSPMEDAVVTAMLRCYGGLFSSYGLIDEGQIAERSGYTQDQVYVTLKGLSEKHIVSYIPRRETPRITFTQSREDAEYVRIPREVYEERLSQFEERIRCMLDYASCINICRSRYLLNYFGEKSSADCGQCDVCETESPAADGDGRDAARKAILDALSDGHLHPVSCLNKIGKRNADIDEALRYMLEREELCVENGMIRIAD